MNKKIVTQFLALTFTIALVTCGICAVFGLLGLTIENAPWLWIIIALCAFSPTIASYVVLIRNDGVKGFKEWLKNVFAFKSPVRHYLLVILLIVALFITQAIVTGLGEVKPFYMFFVLLPLMLIGGGIEEAGWSYVLRPELYKKFGFILSSLIVGVIWTAWHIPVFLPQGRIGSLLSFGLFAVDTIGQSFALGAIVRITKNVFLAVLYHTLINALYVTFFTYDDSLLETTLPVLATVLTAGLLIVISITAVFICEKKSQAVKL